MNQEARFLQINCSLLNLLYHALKSVAVFLFRYMCTRVIRSGIMYGVGGMQWWRIFGDEHQIKLSVFYARYVVCTDTRTCITEHPDNGLCGHSQYILLSIKHGIGLLGLR